MLPSTTCVSFTENYQLCEPAATIQATFGHEPINPDPFVQGLYAPSRRPKQLTQTAPPCFRADLAKVMPNIAI